MAARRAIGVDPESFRKVASGDDEAGSGRGPRRRPARPRRRRAPLAASVTNRSYAEMSTNGGPRRAAADPPSGRGGGWRRGGRSVPDTWGLRRLGAPPPVGSAGPAGGPRGKSVPARPGGVRNTTRVAALVGHRASNPAGKKQSNGAKHRNTLQKRHRGRPPPGPRHRVHATGSSHPNRLTPGGPCGVGQGEDPIAMAGCKWGAPRCM
jgi:hypothetical protein